MQILSLLLLLRRFSTGRDIGRFDIGRFRSREASRLHTSKVAA